MPATDFAMKANLSQSEPKTLQRFAEMNFYKRVNGARTDAPIFRFHDGPPYANGPIHVGHMVNKVLKDMVVRSRLMEGMRCPYTPGWDCHGLPIEHRVLTELSKKGKMKELDALPANERRVAIRAAISNLLLAQGGLRKQRERKSLIGAFARLHRFIQIALKFSHSSIKYIGSDRCNCVRGF